MIRYCETNVFRSLNTWVQIQFITIVAGGKSKASLSQEDLPFTYCNQVNSEADSLNSQQQVYCKAIRPKLAI